jgi:hypothetical protein
MSRVLCKSSWVILPVVVEKSKDVVIDPISARWVHKGSSHGASSASDLAKAAFGVHPVQWTRSHN